MVEEDLGHGAEDGVVRTEKEDLVYACRAHL
jgi:hypothetical protein